MCHPQLSPPFLPLSLVPSTSHSIYVCLSFCLPLLYSPLSLSLFLALSPLSPSFSLSSPPTRLPSLFLSLPPLILYLSLISLWPLPFFSLLSPLVPPSHSGDRQLLGVGAGKQADKSVCSSSLWLLLSAYPSPRRRAHDH